MPLFLQCYFGNDKIMKQGLKRNMVFSQWTEKGHFCNISRVFNSKIGDALEDPPLTGPEFTVAQ